MDTLQLADANPENEGAKDITLRYPVEAGMKCVKSVPLPPF